MAERRQMYGGMYVHVLYIGDTELEIILPKCSDQESFMIIWLWVFLNYVL